MISAATAAPSANVLAPPPDVEQQPLPLTLLASAIMHCTVHVLLPVGPSSHCSPVSTMKSPQVGTRQLVRHASGASALALPLSQPS